MKRHVLLQHFGDNRRLHLHGTTLSVPGYRIRKVADYKASHSRKHHESHI